ncbi:MAG: DUF1214 domain-containing protein [Actinomycetota bacterium]
MDTGDELTAAWDRFVARLGEMGHELLADAPTASDRADALRFLLRQVALREEQLIEFPAGTRPEFFLPESPTRKIFADCPDTIYLQFNVRPDATYRLHGRFGDSPYVSFTAYRAAVTDRVVHDLHDGELTVGDDGTFELIVGGPDGPFDRLDLGDDAAFVIIREYRHDRVNGTPATFGVEQLDPVPGHRPELTSGGLAGALGMMELGLSFGNDATMRLSRALRERPNAMSEAAGELVSEMAGTPHNHYQLCYVQLAEGEALELQLDPPESRYWSVHLNNWWLESPEYRDGQSVCINDAQAERNADGTITMLVGPDDPGGGNWLDTKGRSETILLARYLLPDGALRPISTRLVTI